MALARLRHKLEPGKQFDKWRCPRNCELNQEQRSVWRFLFSEGVNLIVIHRRMRVQYGHRCMSSTKVYEWNEKFKNGITTVEVSSLPGQAVTEDITAVENVIRENRRVTVKEVASLLDISVGSVYHIIHDELKFQKVCARWVPKRLTPEMRDVSMLVKRFCVGMMGMVKHFSSESSLAMRVAYTTYKPERKQQSMEWCHTSSPKSKKVQVQRSAGTVMLTFSWDYSGPILEHYMPRGSTVTSATYSILRENLKPAIRQKRRGLLTRGGCLLLENAKPHTATATVSTIEELRFQCIPRLP